MLLGATVLGCRAGGALPEVGGIYAVADNSSDYGVVKVLALDSGVVHIKLYANRFHELPAQIDVAALRVGKMGDEGGFGIGHLPLSTEHFAAWRPVLRARATVTAEELEGYRLWKESGGGVWK